MKYRRAKIRNLPLVESGTGGYRLWVTLGATETTVKLTWNGQLFLCFDNKVIKKYVWPLNTTHGKIILSILFSVLQLSLLKGWACVCGCSSASQDPQANPRSSVTEYILRRRFRLSSGVATKFSHLSYPSIGRRLAYCSILCSRGHRRLIFPTHSISELE